MDEQTKTLAYPSLKQSWGLLGITVLVALGFQLVLLFISLILTALGLPAASESFITHSATFLVSYVVIFGIVIWYGARKKRRIENGFSPDYSWPSFGNVLLIVLATMAIYFLVEPLVELIPMPEFIENLFAQLLGDLNVWIILAIVIAAPFFEEMLLRGIMLDGLLKLYSPTKAILWSSLFFGILHLNPWQFIPALALGIFMGWIYLRTQSLMATIFIHFIANSSGVILAAFVPESERMLPTRELFGSDALYFAVLALSLVVAVGTIMLLNKTLPHNKPQAVELSTE